MKVVCVSGGFDPVHVGHIRLFEEAKTLGDKLIVILNNDNWLRGKKNFVFMGEKEREHILRTIKYVDDVILTEHPKNPEDMSITNELKKIKPDIFANGGDRKSMEDIPESKICRELGIEMVFNVGGDKIQSSSGLIKKTIELIKRTEK